MTGKIEIFKRDIHGRVVEHRKINNVITDGLKEQLVHMAAGDIGPETARRCITKMQFGSGSLAESATDTHLQLPLPALIKDVTISYPNEGLADDYYVRFVAFLQRTQGNGFGISEAGLMCENLTLAARKTFAAITKDPDYILEFWWTIRC